MESDSVHALYCKGVKSNVIHMIEEEINMKEINSKTNTAADLTVDENNVGSIPSGGLEYHGTLPYPMDSGEGTTDVHLALRPGSFELDETWRIISNDVLSSYLTEQHPDGAEGGSIGFSIKSTGDFTFGHNTYRPNLKFRLENEDRETGEFQVNCTSIILSGQVKLPDFILGTGFSNKALTVNSNGWLSCGDSNWNEATLSSAFKPYNDNYQNTPKYRKINNVVQVRGRISPRSVIAGSATPTTIFTLPREYRPSTPYQYVCQGSGKNTWLLEVSETGSVSFARYGTTSYIDCPVNAWLTFSVIYMHGSDLATSS